jgi:hypothetical protein
VSLREKVKQKNRQTKDLRQIIKMVFFFFFFFFFFAKEIETKTIAFRSINDGTCDGKERATNVLGFSRT